jgi:hypothetical protein
MTDNLREIGEPNALTHEKREVGMPEAVRGDVGHILDTGIVGSGQDLRTHRAGSGGTILAIQ